MVKTGRKSGCLSGCIPRLMIVLLVSGIISLVIFGFMLADRDAIKLDRINPPRIASGPPLPVPTSVSDPQPANLLIRTGRLGDDEITLSLLDYQERDLRWNGPNLNDNTPLALDDSQVYLITDDLQLRALSLADGDQQWEIELPAALAPLCRGCLLATGEFILTLDETGTLSSYEALTGELVWTTTLITIPNRLLRIGDQPAVIDTTASGQPVLLMFDAATGNRLLNIEPACLTETLSPNSPVWYTAGNASLYVLFGYTEHGCVQRWNLDSGELIWETSVQLSRSAWPRDWFDDTLLVADDTMYFGGEQVDRYGKRTGVILALDILDGSIREVSPHPNMMLKPLAVEDDTLIVHAIPAPGTGADELWAISPTGGERYWRYPFDPTTSSWTTQLTTTGLVIIQLLAGPDRIKVNLLNPSTGVLLAETITDIDNAVWSGTTWTDDTAWLTIRSLYAVDLSTGETTLFWPQP
ncbi:MAG TPA: PQQ-binding-like beta-propeller repeat protein [Aggregatilineaceae bacterium]|nr:PQQ-binding-like beta-propeller repeat protein [Aggregatilineaceae bacterium]